MSSGVPILLLDGGLGTTLKDDFNAAVDGTSRPLWSSHLLISAPETLQAAQSAFGEAGADIILTATYQASYEGFSNTKVDHAGEASGKGVSSDDAEKYMRNAVTIARKAFDARQGKVALSLGAYGAVMVPSQEYSGEYDEDHRSVEQLADWHSERLRLFSDHRKTWEDVDLVAFETVPLLAEVEAVRRAMSLCEASEKKKPFWISCVFPGQANTLPDGSSVEQLVGAMLGEVSDSPVPYAIGLNCTKTDKVPRLVLEFETAVQDMISAGRIKEAPALVMYPDGTRGEVYNTTTHEWEKKSDNADVVSLVDTEWRTLLTTAQLPWDHTMSNIVADIRRRGKWSAILVGGCCKTGPSEIRALRDRLS